MKPLKIAVSIIIISLILLFLAFKIFTKKYSVLPEQTTKITTKTDTVWQTKIDTFKVQTIKYKKVYVHKKEISKIVKDTIYIKDSSSYIAAKIYCDTLSNKDIDIYSYDLVKGKLLDSNLSYKLKVPKEIIVTKIIEPPSIQKSGLYLFSEIGGNKHRFDNLSFGLQYNRKGKWFISYRMNMNQINEVTHNVGVGLRLFN